MSRPVLSLALPANLKTKLLQNGIHRAEDFEELELSSESLRFLTSSEVQLISCLAQTQPSIHTGWELSCESRDVQTFLTYIKGLDRLLGGQGIAANRGSVCEIVGQPGEGQTELCLRLTMAVQMKGMRAVYVDSTGSFSYSGSRRAAQKLRDQVQNDCGLGILPETRTLLEGISVFRIYYAHELVALLSEFGDIYQQMNNIGLLVIDTISWPFLASFPESIFRRQALQADVSHMLSQIANKYQIAVVLVSQAKSSSQPGRLRTNQPMDGDVWGRISSNRISISRSAGSGHVVELFSSSMYPTGKTQIEEL